MLRCVIISFLRLFGTLLPAFMSLTQPMNFSNNQKYSQYLFPRFGLLIVRVIRQMSIQGSCQINYSSLNYNVVCPLKWTQWDDRGEIMLWNHSLGTIRISLLHVLSNILELDSLKSGKISISCVGLYQVACDYIVA